MITETTVSVDDMQMIAHIDIDVRYQNNTFAVSTCALRSADVALKVSLI